MQQTCEEKMASFSPPGKSLKQSANDHFSYLASENVFGSEPIPIQTSSAFKENTVTANSLSGPIRESFSGNQTKDNARGSARESLKTQEDSDRDKQQKSRQRQSSSGSTASVKLSNPQQSPSTPAQKSSSPAVSSQAAAASRAAAASPPGAADEAARSRAPAPSRVQARTRSSDSAQRACLLQTS